MTPTTTDAGILVASDEHSLTVGPDGPILLQDHNLIEHGELAACCEWAIAERLGMTMIHSNDGQRRNEVNVEDQFQVTLDVEVIQVNNERARLQFKTDSGTIVRFWYGVESLPITRTFRKHDAD